MNGTEPAEPIGLAEPGGLAQGPDAGEREFGVSPARSMGPPWVELGQEHGIV